MRLLTTVRARLDERRQRRVAAAAAHADAAAALRPVPGPTPRDVAVGGQTSSTVG